MRYAQSKRMAIVVTAVLVCAELISMATRCESAHADEYWRKFDEFSNLSFKKQKQRLANFVVQLRAEPSSMAYIVAHAGRVSCRNEAQKRANRVRNYLISAGQIDPRRIKTIDAGYQNDWVIALYIAPDSVPPLTKDIISWTDGHLSANEIKVLKKCNRAVPKAGDAMRRRA